ncbi:MAG: NADH-ubiquinone oxidoreductase-F iron-sulfur binding region domain-containing protein [Syntrophobacteraceae bacterium]|nr:NADH-ubiquinone oxidoreductase-F iron-sulfur binding region domain-containing protein [Syntrophobacteraceae bacterium]
MKKLKSVVELDQFQKELLGEREGIKKSIAICEGTGCHAYKSNVVADMFEKELKGRGLDAQITVRRTGCHGFCERGPMAKIFPEKIFYFQVKPEDVAEIVDSTLVNNKPVDRLLFLDEKSGKRCAYQHEIPFYQLQNQVVFGNNFMISPRSIEDYIAVGGYSALAKALSAMSPVDVLEEIKKSGLRGRGGGGFPAGVKWETSRNAPGEPKYVIVNADEGDPGAYMDRSILEGNPHSVLEGLMLGAFAIGSSQGFVYVRQEYSIAIENLPIAIEQAKQLGLLGQNILGTDFSFEVTIHQGAGAFVSGESSALMSAIEGRVGEPRPKYIRTAVKGVWDKPSNLNNVETWANVPLIINNGSDWFRSLGTEGSKGTKIFSLVGKVKHTGLVEVPMGVTLRQIVYDIGGGIRNERKFKAVQTGGPSGGCIPEQYMDLPVDFDELSKVGSMMGSGGMIVMDEDTCMVDVAKYFTNFLADESCGKCVPCREGLRQMKRILKDITEGKGKPSDLDTLEELGAFMKDASLCALGQTAANPVLSTLAYFRDEYEAHVLHKQCPARVCRDLIVFHIDPLKCSACGTCRKQCPTDAISGDKKIVHIIDQEKCIKCGTCFQVCPERFSAVTRLPGGPAPAPVAYGTAVVQKAKGESK